MTRAARAQRVLVLLATVMLVLVVPRFLVAKPTNAEVDAAIRSYWGREASAYWMPMLQSASPASKREVAANMENALRALQQRKLSDFSIRQTIIGPPFATRWAYIVRVKTPPSDMYAYFRMSRGFFAAPVSSRWWTAPLY